MLTLSCHSMEIKTTIRNSGFLMYKKNSIHVLRITKFVMPVSVSQLSYYGGFVSLNSFLLKGSLCGAEFTVDVDTFILSKLVRSKPFSRYFGY